MPCTPARPFYSSLTDFMSSGPIVALALEKENAIADLRKLMGATNPANAEEGTIRKKWASSIEHNAIHGSDAEDTARFELSFFFAGYELAKCAAFWAGQPRRAHHALSREILSEQALCGMSAGKSPRSSDSKSGDIDPATSISNLSQRLVQMAFHAIRNLG